MSNITKQMKHKWTSLKVKLFIIKNSKENVVFHNPYYKLWYLNCFAKVCYDFFNLVFYFLLQKSKKICWLCKFFIDGIYYLKFHIFLMYF